ncbi:MAG: acyl-CoA reductase, partial [Polyangiaceae bacterium]
DQRGCLSPRLALVLGDAGRGEAFAAELQEALAALGARVPRGTLAPDEHAGAARWRDTVAFAGRLLSGADHAVAVLPSLLPDTIPPPGRHVLVVPVSPAGGAAAAMAPIARHVVAVGSDDPDAAAPAHTRRSALGAMQHPPLDGPVDLRSSA